MPEEDGKQPLDLEELLDLFREPTELPRKGTNPMWLVLILIAVTAGCWLAVKMTTDLVSGLNAPAEASMSTAKTGARASTEDFAGDVAEDYRERCKKGMTEQEARWIVEDFVKAGLGEGLGSLQNEIQQIFDTTKDSEAWKRGNEDEPPPVNDGQIAQLKSKGRQLAIRQQAWYADALADGLRLDASQQAQVQESGEKFVAERESDFLDYGADLNWARSGFFGSDRGVLKLDILGGLRDGMPEIAGIRLLFPESGLLVANYWIQDLANAPWQRCHLNEAQSAITTLGLVSEGNLTLEKGEWIPRDPPWIKQSNGEDLDVPDIAEEVQSILPFTGEQSFPRDEDGDAMDDDLLLVVTKMHPAQLKLLLLLEPDLAQELGALLEGE